MDDSGGKAVAVRVQGLCEYCWSSQDVDLDGQVSNEQYIMHEKDKKEHLNFRLSEHENDGAVCAGSGCNPAELYDM